MGLYGAIAAVGIAGTAFLLDGPLEKKEFNQPVSPLEKIRVETSDNPTDSADYIKFCFPGETDDARQCTDKATLVSGAGGARVDELVRSLTGEGPEHMTLAHPTDYKAAPQKVYDCQAFNKMKKQGWGAISSADMADEAHFMLRCGLVKIAERAQMPERTSFINGRVSGDDLTAIPGFDWPSFGAAAAGRSADGVTLARDGVWTVFEGDNITAVTEIAHADFNRDERADVLVFLFSRPNDGTARIASFGLIIKDQDTTRLMVPRLY